MWFSSPETCSMRLFECATATDFPSWIWNERFPSLGEDPSEKDAHHSFVRASAHQKSNMGAPNINLREIHALKPPEFKRQAPKNIFKRLRNLPWIVVYLFTFSR